MEGCSVFERKREGEEGKVLIFNTYIFRWKQENRENRQ